MGSKVWKQGCGGEEGIWEMVASPPLGTASPTPPSHSETASASLARRLPLPSRPGPRSGRGERSGQVGGALPHLAGRALLPQGAGHRALGSSSWAGKSSGHLNEVQRSWASWGWRAPEARALLSLPVASLQPGQAPASAGSPPAKRLLRTSLVRACPALLWGNFPKTVSLWLLLSWFSSVYGNRGKGVKPPRDRVPHR